MPSANIEKMREDYNRQKLRDEQRSDIRFGQEHELALGRQGHEAEAAAFARREELIRPYLDELSSGAMLQPSTAGEMSESERILIQSQQDVAERDIFRLQDTLSEAGTFSTGQLTVGTGEILGRARGQVAKTSAQFAESRLEREHQERLRKRQELVDLVTAILA